MENEKLRPQDMTFGYLEVQIMILDGQLDAIKSLGKKNEGKTTNEIIQEFVERQKEKV